MWIYRRSHSLALATALCIVLVSVASAARSGTSSHALVAQADTPAAAGSAQEGAKDASPGGMTDDMMDEDMMGMGRSGMMGHGMGDRTGRAMGMMPMSGAARMKVMFAIVDTNGDGALSFEEITAVHKRVFDVIDANKDGKVTMEELRAFMQQ